MTERDIVHVDGEFWVAKDNRAGTSYTVYKDGATHATADSSYSDVSLAIARCDYLALQAKVPDAIKTFTERLQEELMTRFESLVAYAEDEREAGNDEPLPVWDEQTVYLLTQDMESSDVFPSFQKEIMDWWITKGVYRYVEDGEPVDRVPKRNRTEVWPYFRGSRVEFVRHLWTKNMYMCIAVRQDGSIDFGFNFGRNGEIEFTSQLGFTEIRSWENFLHRAIISGALEEFNYPIKVRASLT
jgi:hypothetical protein